MEEGAAESVTATKRERLQWRVVGAGVDGCEEEGWRRVQRVVRAAVAVSQCDVGTAKSAQTNASRGRGGEDGTRRGAPGVCRVVRREGRVGMGRVGVRWEPAGSV
jgi:hypothetical protein